MTAGCTTQIDNAEEREADVKDQGILSEVLNQTRTKLLIKLY